MDEGKRSAIVASRDAARAVARHWQQGPEYRALVRAFADCPPDRAEPAAEQAERLFADTGWAEALIAPLLAELARDPFYEPPFKVSRDASRIGAILFDCPAVSIIASVTSAAAMAALPAPASMIFTGRVSVTRYLRSGNATLRRWRGEPVEELPSITLPDDEVRRLDGRVEAQLTGGARSDMVTLAATIRPGAALLMREVAVADGKLMRSASIDDRASRTEMLLAFLRLSGRADAGDRFEAATRDAAFHLRWAAMREWLALDARAALPRLAQMARCDADPEVRAAAVRTLTTVERRIGEARCPA